MVLTWIGSGKLRLASSRQTLATCLFVCLAAVHVPFATNGFRAYTVTLGLFLYLPFFVSILLFLDTYARLKAFFMWWSLVGIYLGVMGVLGGGVVGTGFLGDENDFALLMNTMLPFILSMFVLARRTFMKILYMGGAMVCVASIVISNSRGGFVGLVAALTIICIASPRKLVALTLAGILALGVYAVADEAYWNRISSIQATDEGTAKERTESWQAGWDMFKEYPLGIGPGNFPVRFPEFQPDSMERNMWGRQAHSLWFTLLPELGVPGVLLYLWLLWINMRDIWRMRRAGETTKGNDPRYFGYLLSVAFMASLTGFFASATFLSVLYYPHYWYLTALIVVSRRIADHLDSRTGMTPRPHHREAPPRGAAGGQPA